MRDALRRLEREAEIRGGLRRPLLEHLAPGHRAERVVYLHRGQPLGVVREHLRARELGRIETTQPFLVAEARSADADCRRHILYIFYIFYILGTCISNVCVLPHGNRRVFERQARAARQHGLPWHIQRIVRN